MAEDTTDDGNSPLDVVKKGLRELADTDIELITKKSALGPFNFDRFSTTFHEIAEFARDLLSLPLEHLTEDRIEAIRSSGDAVANCILEIKNFKPENVENPGSTRDQLGGSLKNSYINFVSTLRHDLPVLLLKKKPASEAEIGKKLNEANQIIIDLREKESQMNSILEASRTAAGQIGVDAHSTDFHALAANHEKTAQKWLYATIALIGAAVALPLVYLWLFPLEGDWSNVVNVQRVVTKVAILFIVYFMISQAAKNYRTHRHLYVVNKHRETSLKTFRTFVESAESDLLIKTQILLEAARTVFSPTHTGYLGADDDNPNNRIVEIMKMVKDSKP